MACTAESTHVALPVMDDALRGNLPLLKDAPSSASPSMRNGILG